MNTKKIAGLILLVMGISVFAEQDNKVNDKTLLLLRFDEKAGELPTDSSNNKEKNIIKGVKATADEGVSGCAIKYGRNVQNLAKVYGLEKAMNAGKIEFWFKPDEKTIDRWGGDQSIISQNRGGSHAGDFSIGFRMNPVANGGGSFYFLIEDGKGKYRKLITSPFIKSSKWYHIEITWDSKSTPVIKIDDQVQKLRESGKNTTYNGPILNAGNSIGIGNSNGTKDGFILIDELKISSL